MGISKKNNKKNAINEIYVAGGSSLDDVVEQLIELNNKGMYNFFACFNGVKLYSADITYDDAYLKVTGFTRDEFKQKLKETQELAKKKLEEAKQISSEKLDERIEIGSKYISIYKKDAWSEYVTEISNLDMDTNHALDTIIKYLQLLADDEYGNFTVEQIATQFINEFDEIGDWYSSAIASAIARFSDKGPDFDYEVWQQVKNKVNRPIYSHAKYVKELRDINKLNDMYNVKYEDAKNIVGGVYYHIDYSDYHDELSVDFIETGANGIFGIADQGELVVGGKINEFIVLYTISESEKTKRYIIDTCLSDIMILEDETYIYNSEPTLNIVKRRRNLKDIANLYKYIKSVIKNLSVLPAGKINLANADLMSLQSFTDDDITNIEKFAREIRKHSTTKKRS